MPSPDVWWGQTHPLQKDPHSHSSSPVKTKKASPWGGWCWSLPAGSTTLHPPAFSVSDHIISTPSRLTHDISLEEFEDEDLSEITDECGISLHCKESLATRVSAMGIRMETGMGRE